jgi:methylated-DNA-[protein]-cysteine S-methyltransferase
MTYRTTIDSPIGELTLTSDGNAITEIWMGEAKPLPGAVYKPDLPVFQEAARQFAAYFKRERTDFDFALRPQGTPFQLSVWEELKRIPYGTTTSYGELARRIGNPAGSRAVGLANGKNPLPIVVPCHRVIGANGSLVGFGGGLERKRFLLDLERGERALL